MARTLAEGALAICREHGMGHIGPQTFGICALIETDVDARQRLLAEGEAQLAQGCVSHNHISLRQFAIDVSLEIGDWQAAEHYCANIHAYTADEPLPLSDFIIARGLALARFGRGERGADLYAALVGLRKAAADAELNSALPGIENALAGSGAPPPAAAQER